MKNFSDTAFRLVSFLPPEQARATALFGTRFLKSSRVVDSSRLQQNLWSLLFSNPIGLAAGFDKDAIAVSSLGKMGFGFVEIGSITKNPRRGNRKRPRMFRLPQDQAMINQLSLPNDGLQRIEQRLRRHFNRAQRSAESIHQRVRPVLGANIAPDPDNFDAASCCEEMVSCFQSLQPVVDYITLNVSCPNGERRFLDLVPPKKIAKLVEDMRAVEPGKRRIPLLVKLSPDFLPNEYLTLADLAIDGVFDGIIAGNTTAARTTALRSPDANEVGGLSGKPLAQGTDRLLAELYRHTKGKVVLIGCGGVFSVQDAMRQILNGASLVQLYTGLAYRGPRLVDQMRFEFSTMLRQYKLSSIGEAVGKAVS